MSNNLSSAMGSIDFAAINEQTDGILKELGLYDVVTYVEETLEDSSYNPLTGDFGTKSIKTFTFNAVILTEGNFGENNSSYGLSQSLVVLPSEIRFKLNVDQVFQIDDEEWLVKSFNVAPKKTLYTIQIVRK